MPVGAFGIIYCSETQEYSTPFVVLSKADPNLSISDVWPETWVLPFGIRPLGNPSKAVQRSAMQTLLPSLQTNPQMSVDDLLEVRGVQAFNASSISQADWSALFGALVV
jgi:hypothetical protein